MFATDIDGLVLKRIESFKNAFEIVFNRLEKSRSQIKEAAEKAAFLDLLKVMRWECQRAGNAASGQ